jgi:hypothetical protein
MVRQAYIKEVKRLASYYRIRRPSFVTFPMGSNVAGYYHHGKIFMNIRLNRPRCRFISTFFHELGHYHCGRYGIWKKYHQGHADPHTYRYFKLMSLKIERWVDRWAAREMKRWYPRMKYSFNYYRPGVVKIHHETLWRECHSLEE